MQLNHPIWHTHSVAARSPGEVMSLQSGDGSFVVDADGRAYINGFAGLSLALGLGATELVEAVSQQLQTLAYAPLFRSTHAPGLALAQRLVALCPEDLSRVVFSLSGAEAVEAACKIARQYFALRGAPGRQRVVVLQESYHGCTLGTLPLSGVYGDAYRDVYGLDDTRVRKLAGPYCYRCPFGLSPASCRLECAQALEGLIAREGADTIAALLVEPIPAAGGLLVPPAEYLRTLADICRRHGILLIVDESATAFGRAGTLFAFQRSGVVPDMLIVAKALDGGYLPLGATIVREDIFRPFVEAEAVLVHGSSQAGNPCAAAAALAFLDVLADTDLLAHAEATGARILAGLTALRRFPCVGDVRGLGMMFAIELVRDRRTKEPLDDEATRAVFQKIQGRGLILHAKKNRLLFFPPLNITADVADRAVGVITSVLGEHAEAPCP